MTFEYINKLTQFGKTTYEVLITTDLGQYRSTVKFAEGDDTEEAKQLKAEAIADAMDGEARRLKVKESVFQKVAAGEEFMKSYIASHPSITLEQFAAVNGLVNQAMSDIGIVLDAPNLTEMLKLRVEESIAKIQHDLALMEMTEELETKVDTALATIMGAMQ
jgi:hypothetical protein